MMANNKKTISPVTHPAIITKVGLNPDARDLEIIANTPGPGVAASTSIAIAKLKIEIKLILIPYNYLNKNLIDYHLTHVFSSSLFMALT
jgi:hypothetical protein